MLLADGNTNEFQTLQLSSCETYLLKLENHIDKIESLKKQVENLKKVK